MRHSENGMSAVPSMADAPEPPFDTGSLVPATEVIADYIFGLLNH
jgi:hypothetical protein